MGFRWVSKTKRWQNLHGTILGGKSIGLDQKQKRELKSRAHDLKNQNNNKFLVLKV
jgi:hypothetical protein